MSFLKQNGRHGTAREAGAKSVAAHPSREQFSPQRAKNARWGPRLRDEWGTQNGGGTGEKQVPPLLQAQGRNDNGKAKDNRKADAAAACAAAHGGFSAYLDGTMSGVEMAAISAHFDGCRSCSAEFATWRAVQRALGDLGPAQPPISLQARLRAAIAAERERGTYLSFPKRAQLAWKNSIGPMALRVSGGLAAALVLVGALGWMFAAPTSVQANDARMTHMVAPHYLYSYVLPQPIETRHDVPVVVEAKVDTNGRVYDYTILAGPKDPQVRLDIENNLLSSIFEPATLFGVPVRGHLVMTYAGVSVRG